MQSILARLASGAAIVLFSTATGVAAAYLSPFELVGVLLLPVAAYYGWRVALLAAVDQRFMTLALIGGSITVLRLPALIPDQPALRVVVLAPFLAFVAVSGRPLLGVDKRTAFVTGAFLVVAVTTLLRGASTGNYGSWFGAVSGSMFYVTVGAFAYVAFTRAPPAEMHARLRALAFSPAVYALVNLALYAVGVRNAQLGQGDVAVAAGGSAQLLGLFGIDAVRLFMPLTDGVNNFGVVCGMGLAASIVLVVRDSGGRTMAGGAAMVLTVALLLGDSRLALFGAVLIGSLIALVPRIRAARGIALLAPLAPVALIAALGALARSSLNASLSGQGRSLATGSGREQIWSGVWDYLRAGSFHDFYGYGAGGQVGSGASRSYASVFSAEANPLAFSTHNGFLQQILDAGYIGLLVLLAVFLVCLGRLARADTAVTASLFAAVAALLVGGITEAAPTYYSPEALLLFIMICVASSVRSAETSRFATTTPATPQHRTTRRVPDKTAGVPVL